MLRRMAKAFMVVMVMTVGAAVALGALAQELSKEEKEESEKEKKEGFVSLFNGKDLSGWVLEGAKSWEVQDGVLVCTGEGGGWLRSEKEFENFILRLEYKISKGGNSGIFIRSTKQGNPAFTGMELQILDDHGRQPTKHTAMAIYAAVAPSKNMSKPAGEWNKVEAACKGRQLAVVWNGEKVLDVNLDDDTIDTGGHPKLSQRAKKGHIGLQNHGSHVEFRNIRIKVIEE